LALKPPCPANYGATLRCKALSLSDLRFEDYQPVDHESVQFAGLQLRGSRVEVDARPGGEVRAGLWWVLAAPRQETDIRFVHIVDSSGQLIAQDDRALGQQAAGGQWLEQVVITLPEDLPAGEYRVFTGWYTYPELLRFPVLSPVEGAADGLALIARFDL
jgi:hypothetical protein